MFPDDIKKFVIDSNKEKVMLKEFDTSKRNQDIKTKVYGGGQDRSSSYGATVGSSGNNRGNV